MGKHVVLVGGGHAHLTCLKMLKHMVDRDHRVTLISPDAYHYYSGMRNPCRKSRSQISESPSTKAAQ